MHSNNFKKFIFLIFVLLLVWTYNKTLAQAWANLPATIYTPNGSLVEDSWIRPEMTLSDIEYWNSRIDSVWPNATRLGDASQTYNCHGYAWHMTEGGENVWIGTFPPLGEESIYWEDSSYYEQTSQAPSQKVSYRKIGGLPRDHSAITTLVEDKFISKWGKKPLMEHSYDYCPYWYEGYSLKYYKRPGSEDYILVTLDLEHYSVGVPYKGQNHRAFIDNEPYGDEIEEWGKWRITALTSCDEVLVYETNIDEYINIPPLPDGYDWLRDENGHVLANISTSGIDTDGFNHVGFAETKISNVPDNFINSGTLSTNTTWRSCVTITGDIIVPSGITLRIEAGSKIVFQNNASLLIDGSLIATNCELSGNFNTWGWGSITFDGSSTSNSVLDTVVVKNGMGIYCLNGANISIKNSLIDNCIYGIYVNSSQPTILNCHIEFNHYGLMIFNSYSQNWYSRDIKNNYIYHNSVYGIYLYNSSPTITGNNVSSNRSGMVLWPGSNPILDTNKFASSYSYYGIACYGSADPDCYYNPNYDFGGKNQIINNNTQGIIITGNSNPNFGNPYLDGFGGYNEIADNNGYEVENRTENDIFAGYNWWGNASGPSEGDILGSVLFEPWLLEDPWPPTDIQGVMDGGGGNPSNNLPAVLYQGLSNQMLGNFQISSNIFKNYFLNHPGSKFSKYAANQFVKSLCFYLTPSEVASEIESTLSDTLSNTITSILISKQVSQLIRADSYNTALEKLNTALNLDTQLELRNSLLFQKSFLYRYSLGEPAPGIECLQEIISNNPPNSIDYQLAQEELILMQNINLFIPKKGLDKLVSTIPAEYKLFQNYPNPFNPATKIDYNIPKESIVQLKVYDILGREISTLVNKKQQPGNYSVRFDASYLPSGVYIYRIVSGNFIATKKMILLK